MKKYIISISILLVISVSILIGLFYNKNIQKEGIEFINENNSNSNSNNLISVMLENEAGTGNYEKSDNGFPTEGYVLNKNLSKCVNGSKLSFSDGYLYVKGNTSDRCYAYFDKNELGSICKNENMVECFTKNYKKDSTIIYHDGKPDYSEEDNYELEAEDLSYRYTGGNDIVHNYVCLDNKKSGNCELGDLYRIIGLFKNNDEKYEIKLIKADYTTSEQTGGVGVGEYNNYYEITDGRFTNYKGELKKEKITKYFWNNISTTANWLESNLNKVNLNEYFYNYLINKNNYLEKLIIIHSWVVGGNTWEKIYGKASQNAKSVYEAEIINPGKDLQETQKIGLMYVSDYYYSLNSKLWAKKITHNVADNIESNGVDSWLYLGSYEWFITSCTDNRGSYTIYPSGGVSMVSRSYPDDDGERAVSIRPTFYLDTNTKLKSGNGTKENPYRISLN